MAAMSKIKVTYLDGRVEIVLAGPRAQVDLERHFKISLGEANKLEHVYYLAWTALHLAGKEPREFDVWLDDLAEIDPLGDEDANPTPETP